MQRSNYSTQARRPCSAADTASPASSHPRASAEAFLLGSAPQALFDLEATNAELKADLHDLYITGAKEVDIHGAQGRKAIIVHVSCAQCVWGARMEGMSGAHVEGI